ncbi:MAG: CcmD family protein [Actinomycetota bacterium]|nr:CcmD family protein [Actinomycetota bacterium]
MSYVYAGYGVTLIALGAYALRLAVRARTLRRRIER